MKASRKNGPLSVSVSVSPCLCVSVSPCIYIRVSVSVVSLSEFLYLHVQGRRRDFSPVGQAFLFISFTACSPNFSGGNNIVLPPQPHLSGGKLPPLSYGDAAHVHVSFRFHLSVYLTYHNLNIEVIPVRIQHCIFCLPLCLRCIFMFS